jgi:hypothetical protein
VQRLEREIRAVLDGFGPQGRMPELLAAWPEAVGDMVAANAWPARIARDGTLHVNTSSSTWAFELAQLAPTVLERLRQKLGESAPKALRFVVGHLPEPGASKRGEARADSPRPTPEVLQTAAELAGEIEDEALRKRIAQAIAASLSRGRSDSPF